MSPARHSDPEWQRSGALLLFKCSVSKSLYVYNGGTVLPLFLDIKRCNVVLELVLFDLTECLITQLLVLLQVCCLLSSFMNQVRVDSAKAW